ncbi:FMN reductase (NADH) RutF [Roseovarius albus]|uniref:FMN reductase (NADH) RutF n=1 Tax=Roseovarius albus TaxID=1247867 RepID=A0A1X6YCB4_9RHOB|nr:flavin reductase family protein [Roseovarius albus]SLN16313.1 FMN reductase (NADH) RutF [Roseovarius albus]
MSNTEQNLVARDAFISAMRGVASSVTVVATDGPAGKLGATVSAFSSVSADPPTVLVCLFAESRIAKAVTENGEFTVNVLAEGASHVADRFAGRHDRDVSDRFEGIAHGDTTHGMPGLSDATVFCCDLDQAVRSGSHLIVLGHVRSVSDGQSRPLTYRDGCYHSVIPQDQIMAVAAE